MADWSLVAANLADLVDLMTYWLRAEYAKWTTDPDDPEVKADLARRKRERIKPPPIPIIQPVAARPPSLERLYQQQYTELLERYGQALPEDVQKNGIEIRPGTRRVSSDAWDAALGI